MAIPIPKQYIADFENLGFGMFIHWGLYSQLCIGEWALHLHKIDMNEYKKLADTFTAEDFDPEAIAVMAKNAGCKYIVLTTRHHEGFSLYDTCGLDEFDVMHSAAGRDLIREYVNACRKHDIVPFFYHTTLDWYREDFQNDFDGYLEYLRKSVEVLCTNYGKIGGLWFDGNWSKPDADWKLDELYATIRKHQPEAMIINNTGMGALGQISHPEVDSVTFEQGRPKPMKRDGMPKYIAAEMCETINDHWGIGHNDLNYKSPMHLIESLCFSRYAGANYLLNIGPTAQGGIDEYQKALFGLIGKWMDKFGEAIYNGRPYETGCCNTKNFVLKSKNNDALYIFCFDLGKNGHENVTWGNNYAGNIAFGNVNDTVKKIFWLDNNEKLNFSQNDNCLTVNFTGYKYGDQYCVRVAKAEI